MKKPRILFFDIETMANLSRVWGKWEQDVIAVERHWYMLTFAWKWLGESKTYVHSLPDFPLYKKDKYNDKSLILVLWKLFDEADVIIAHNGNDFDIKKTNARFIKHHLPPPSPYIKVDTKLIAKRYFKFDSNKLDDLGDYFNIGRKINTGGWPLWQGCEDGDPKAWEKMCKYNKQDVILLEKVYLAMLPYIDNHPNVAMLRGETVACPNCGSLDVQKRGLNTLNTRQRWSCMSCKSWHTSALKEGSQIK